MMTQTLLIELLTEELPPKALNNLGNHFAAAVAEGLEKAQLVDGAAEFTAYASPRRLAVQVKNVKAVQADQKIVKKGPAVANAVKDGAPTKALEGFARGAGAKIEDLTIVHDGKQDVYAYEYVQTGKPLGELLEDIINAAVKKLPIPKVMRWGSSTFTFVRPVHGLIVLHGGDIVNVSVLGLQSGNQTLGHRFLSDGEITIENADSYAAQMRGQGKVVASFAERKAAIQTALEGQARRLNAAVAADEALLDEVTALVEWPVVLEAGFEEHFLAVPQECLILTMQQNQKYFPLLDRNGKLMNRFLLVSNLQTEDPSHIIQGNERVLRARLSDAEFFYKQDQKATLESRLPKLSGVVYHNKIGSQAERIERLQSIAAHIAKALGADAAAAERAARLAKADLVTEMVGEFPELQGTMGKYYARLDGETEEIAEAVEQHYWPRFAGDNLPQSKIAIAVALADKLETLVGIWGIGQIPTGDKDPYALRRATLGILRILMLPECKGDQLGLGQLINETYQTFPRGWKDMANPLEQQHFVSNITSFIETRLAILLQNEYSQDVISAVLKGPKQTPEESKQGVSRLFHKLYNLPAKLQAVAAFKQLPEAAALAAANKRVQNLLKKADAELGTVNESLLQQDEEKALYAAAQGLQPKIAAAVAEGNFQTALSELASVKPQVDAFFDGVMVMADDAAVKQNRLNLLNRLAEQMNAVADIALLGE
ncbi:glycine--tRNA ligase subunit beta [Neisseria meningitidis]|uniref:glycine--tRNA ligase subunit beta n=1 Tax=Neisseria meningitidis TaxID=487 RepID=UPI000766A327|nr:glycine--tRNA ligase subunit beta [Neisseria meningitidis]CWP64724.1 glycyl-tRNA synthetase subunit beta [Neisseria meningitidis]CWQ06443.1 glycyl-tRNA synthetase subunit beta [Neisseria meningitidis]CWT70497.1 glycyl-tRNA synthetase subunit beta [Neisseria meningitidis]CWT76063.1 glycyl-tRNA synthetase subunit beta [Neisseria meningitidis]